MMDGDVFTDKKATEGQFKSVSHAYQIIHLAMHAWAHDSVAALSGMVFQAPTDSSENGILFLQEMYNLPLLADLIVLSGCQTGRGKSLRGEGIMSVGRAFKYAGTSNIIFSLWAVDDEATGMLMTSFYKNLKSGFPKDEAFQQAKIALMSNPKFAHPYYWSPFVLVGDDRAINFVSSPIRRLPIFLGILAIGLVLVWINIKRLLSQVQPKI